VRHFLPLMKGHTNCHLTNSLQIDLFPSQDWARNSDTELESLPDIALRMRIS